MALTTSNDAAITQITGSLQVTNDTRSGNAGVATINTLALAEGVTTPQALATGTAIILTPANTSIVRVSAAAATTGASLPAGTVNGQLLFIEVTTAIANTITFAAAGTSLVAGGA